MVDVFISYSRADVDAVRQLARKIEAEGYEVWWDAELPPHKSYGEVIEEKVAMSKAAVVVWSATAGQSEWVRAEADLARNAKKLIQTALGDIMPPLPFNQIQFANIGDWKGEDDHPGWRKVKASLSELCGEGAARPATTFPSSPPPVPPSPAPTPTPVQAFAGPPPGSLEAHRSTGTNVPLIAGIGCGALGLLGGGVLLVAALGQAGEEMPEKPVALADMGEPTSEATPEAAPSPTATAEPADIAPSPDAPAAPAGPAYATGPQSFSGSLNLNQSRTFSVGLNAGTSYMIVGQCDLDCSDIDMWLYDENGNLIDEDTLDDDAPVLQVTPVRSAQFQIRVQMFTCTVEPCGIEVAVSPM